MQYLNFRDYLLKILNDIDCVIAYETASEYLGLFDGYLYDNRISIFVENILDLSNLETENEIKISQFIINDYKNLDFIILDKLKVTSENQTLINLIEQDGDVQVIQQSLANYYYKHGDFKNLKIPNSLKDLFNEYCEWALDYYKE